jgi:hypothetical protein
MAIRTFQAILILVCILLSGLCNGSNGEGYKCLIRQGEGFIAAGTGGKIDWISVSGKIIRSEVFPGESFISLLEYDNKIIAAGERGTLIISSGNGIFRKVESGTVRNINSLAVLNGLIIAGADQGEIITGDGIGPFKKTRLALKGNIVSVSARSTECFGVTDQGEIIHTRNGSDWEITDFNKMYAGYYKPCFFTAVLVTENRIGVTGIRNDGSPVMMFSNKGGVWTERILNYTDESGINGNLKEKPYAIAYHEPADEYYIACSDGKIISLPSCSQCNKLLVLSGADLEGISCSEKNLVVVGENFYIGRLSPGF